MIAALQQGVSAGPGDGVPATASEGHRSTRPTPPDVAAAIEDLEWLMTEAPEAEKEALRGQYVVVFERRIVDADTDAAILEQRARARLNIPPRRLALTYLMKPDDDLHVEIVDVEG